MFSAKKIFLTGGVLSAILVAGAARSPDSLVNNLFAQIFAEALPSDLVKIAGSQVRLNKTAAAAFEVMAAAARSAEVSLKPRSGFRSISQQRGLMDAFTKRFNSEYAHKVLKTAGESEHHTGYAIDIDDGKNPVCSLQSCFEKTAAYRWLNKNAAAFGFELSYPRGNNDGIAFEPWHWRFIGSKEAVRALKK